jgi:hypothetical protein
LRQGHVADATFWARPGLKSGSDKGIEAGHVGDTAAFNGMPDPVLELAARAMGVVTGLAALEPDPRAPGAGVLLDAALQAATGLQQLLAFRHDGTTVTTPAEQAAATAGLTSAAAGLGKAAEALHGLEGPERFLVRLPLGQLLLVIGAAVAVPVPDLGDRGHVDGMVDAPVAAQR